MQVHVYSLGVDRDFVLPDTVLAQETSAPVFVSALVDAGRWMIVAPLHFRAFVAFGLCLVSGRLP